MINLFGKLFSYTPTQNALRDEMAFVFLHPVSSIISIERINLSKFSESTVVVFRDKRFSEQYYNISREQHEGLVKAFFQGLKSPSGTMYFSSTKTIEIENIITHIKGLHDAHKWSIKNHNTNKHTEINTNDNKHTEINES